MVDGDGDNGDGGMVYSVSGKFVSSKSCNHVLFVTPWIIDLHFKHYVTNLDIFPGFMFSLALGFLVQNLVIKIS